MAKVLVVPSWFYWYNVYMKYCEDCNKQLVKSTARWCKPHGYKHRTRPSGLKYTLHKINPTSFKKGHVPANKGVPSPFLKEKPGYDAIHEWVDRWAEDPKSCSNCGSTQRLEWSNKTGKYLRDLSDWQRLCKKCHARYDFEKFGARKKFFV